jgi:hypothetical protein
MHHRLLSTRLSRRAIAAVAVLFVAAAALVVGVLDRSEAVAGPGRRSPRSAGPSPGAASMAEAVARTVATPLVRVHLELTPPHGPPLTIAGVAGLATDDVDLSVTLGDREAGRYRIIGEQAWIGSRHAGWLSPLSASDLRGTTTTAWRDLLRQLRPSPGGAELAGHPATVELDDRGRIRRVRAELSKSTFDLRLDGYDDDLAIVPPP